MKTTVNGAAIETKEHSHIPNHVDEGKSTLSSNLKKFARVDTKASRRTIVSRTLRNTDLEPIIEAIPTTKSLLEKVTRERRRNGVGGVVPVENIEMSNSMSMFSPTEMFLLYDSGPSKKRTMVFGSSQCCHILEKSEHIFIDATFDAAPLGFAQLLSVHGML